MPVRTKIVEPIGNAHDIAELAESLQPQRIEPTEQASATKAAGLQEYGAPRYVPDKYSREIQLRNAIRQASREVAPDVQVPVSEKEVAFLRRLYEQTQRAEYNRFIETAFDRSDPANRKLFLEMVPDFARIREQLIDNEADIQTKIAKLMITGIQSEDDIKFVYALNQGTIVLPDKPLFDPTGSISGFDQYQNGPFAPPISVRKHVILDDLNRKLGFAAGTPWTTDQQRRNLTKGDLGFDQNTTGELANSLARAIYQKN